MRGEVYSGFSGSSARIALRGSKKEVALIPQQRPVGSDQELVSLLNKSL